MNTTRTIIVTFLFIVVSFTYCSFQTDQPLPLLAIDEKATQVEKLEVIDQWLDMLEDERIFNGAVLIAKDGKALLKNAYGYTNASLTEKLTPNSMFRLASLSKQFTSMGIMILKEKGLLEFDDKVSKYIPDLPYKNISIRNLLNHTAGIPDNYLNLYDDEMGILTNEKAIELVIQANQKAPKKPSEEYSYSNTGYILAARTIEVVSGLSIEKFLDEELFKPMQMSQTRIWNLISKEKTFTNKTSSFKYVGDNAVELKPTGIDGVAGDGAVFSSINDFLIWDQFLYSNSIVSDSTLGEAFVTPTLLDGSKSDYGFGWGVNGNIVSHTGAWLGARTVIRRDTENKTCVVVLDNAQGKKVSEISNQIVKSLF